MTGKRILAVYYSHSGDVEHAIRQLLGPLDGLMDVEVTWLRAEVDPPHPFPWPMYDFFANCCESIGELPAPLQPTASLKSTYDLVVVGWQVWFLRPSPPIRAILARIGEAGVLRNVPVASLCCCRQMWAAAHARLVRIVSQAGGRVVGDIVLQHRGGGRTFVTTPLRLTSRRGSAAEAWRTPFAPGAEVLLDSCAGRLAQWLSGERTEAALFAGLTTTARDPRFVWAEAVGDLYMTAWRPLFRRFGRPGQWTRRPIVHIFTTTLALLVPVVVPVLWTGSWLTGVLARPLARSPPRKLDVFTG